MANPLARWCWAGDTGDWVYYDSNLNIMIECSFASKNRIDFKGSNGQDYFIDFTKNIQYLTTDVHRQRKVKRVDPMESLNVKEKDKFILWVDDIPSGNKSLVEKARAHGIQVVEAVTTAAAISYFKQHYDVLINAEVRVITDMHRIEEGVEVPNAGEILMQSMVINKFNFPIMCFTSAKRVQAMRELYPNVWTTDNSTECQKFVLFQTSAKVLNEMVTLFEGSLAKVHLQKGSSIPFVSPVENKSELINPIKHFSNAPRHPVTHSKNGKNGIIIGWEMKNSYQAHSNQVVVHFEDGTYESCPLNVLSSKSDTLNPPWYHRQSRVWKSPAIKEIMREIVSLKIEGMNITFQHVFEAIWKIGVPVFIVGGAVRDLVLGKTKDEIKDIDIGFGCSSHEIETLAKNNGWWQPDYLHSPFGMIAIGDRTKDLYLEGKAINGLNNDRNRVSGVPSTIGTDLYLENMYRDWCCNALWYDPLNYVVVDPTGYGYEDALNLVLRIPVERHQWSAWVEGNLTKIFRYWKFIARGLKPHDSATKDFIISAATNPNYIAMLQKNNDFKFFLVKGVCACKKDGAARIKQKAFKDAVVADLGVTYYKVHFGPHEI